MASTSYTYLQYVFDGDVYFVKIVLFYCVTERP
jgi:hypothetical protein